MYEDVKMKHYCVQIIYANKNIKTKLMYIDVKLKSGLWLMSMSLVGQLCHSNVKCFILELCGIFETGSHFATHYVSQPGMENMANAPASAS